MRDLHKLLIIFLLVIILGSIGLDTYKFKEGNTNKTKTNNKENMEGEGGEEDTEDCDPDSEDYQKCLDSKNTETDNTKM